MGRSWDKFRLLLWKNWLLQRRNPKGTICDIIIPVVFCLGLVILRYHIKPIDVKESSTFKPFSPSHFPAVNKMSFGEEINVNVTLTEEQIEQICQYITTGKLTEIPKLNLTTNETISSLFKRSRRQMPSTWEKLEVVVPGATDILSKLWVVLYSPKSPILKKFMTDVATVKQFIGCGMPSSQELEDFFYYPRNYISTYDVVLAGIVFDKSFLNDNKLPADVNITIRLRSERSGYTYTWLTELLFPLLQLPGPRDKRDKEGGPPGYYSTGFLGLQSALSQTVLQYKGVTKLPNIEMQRFPYPPYEQNPILTMMENSIQLIIVLCFMHSAIATVRLITTEKEKQLKESMKMMGLPNWLHWLAWFIKTFIFFFITIVLITVLLSAPITGSDNYVLNYTDWSCLLAFFITYIVASITFCFMVSTFFTKANTGTFITSILWLVCYSPYWFLQKQYWKASLGAKLGVSLFSNSAMGLGFQIIMTYEGIGAGLQWHNLLRPASPSDTLTMGHIMGMLLIDSIIYMLITIYVEGIYPGEFGVPRPWNFPFTRSYWMGEPLNLNYDEAEIDAKALAGVFEDEPKKLTVGVRIQGLRKVYPNGKTAVHGLSLNMYEGQITVLLGHNGAGKTTTMSMLTGLYPPTSGTATISGHDIRTDIDGARETIGLCPQHNVLFDKLTVQEHLDFFGQLKGLKGENLKKETDRFIKMVELENKRSALSKTLSGGMKRKLAASVALCGGSKVVLFDEPTSGMDPAARRSLWDVLQAEKAGRTILLTTHFMDEADLLGDRIAIMSEGHLRTVGSSFFLKKQYGGGYHLIMVKDNSCQPHLVTETLNKYIPGISPTADIGAELSYHLDDSYKNIFETMFTELEKNKVDLGISSYGVSLTTMEEVFMKVGSEHEVGKNENGVTDTGKDHVNLQMKPVVLLKNPQLCLKQAWSMLFKCALSTWRSWILYLIFILVPLIKLCFALLMGNKSSETGFQPRSFSLKDYYGAVAIYKDLGGADPKLISSYHDLLIRDEAKIRDLNKLNVNLNVNDYIMNESTIDIASVSQTYIIGTAFEKDNITAMFNNQPYHVPPLALSYIYNAILRAENTSTTINIVNNPLPYTAASQIEKTTEESDVDYSMTFLLSFVSSYFIIFYVRERVSKAKHLQFVSGVNVATFWSVALAYDIILSLGPIASIILTLYASQKEGLSTSDELCRAFVIMLCSMLASIPMSYLASFFFDTPASGFIRLLIIHVLTGIVLFFFVKILKMIAPDQAAMYDTLFSIFPMYTLALAFLNLNKNSMFLKMCEPLANDCSKGIPHVCCKDHNCGKDKCLEYTENYYDLNPPGIGKYIATFIVIGAIYFAILLFIDYGVWKMLSCKGRNKVGSTSVTDSDVISERQRIADLNEKERNEYNLLLQNVTKDYKKFRAVNNLSLGVKQGECFGLLGVNGAGKTTTFKMMTGDETITSGNAFVRGLSLKYKMKQVYQLIGYCPQFDAFLDYFTGRETLRIYCLIRGVPSYEITALSEKLAKDLLFFKHIDKKVKEYSGGNKRKLSTAVALVGDPQVVYLDEPTTGMDPVAKRHLWNVICKVRDAGKTIILTSHSMEECEALCTRLAIMVNGEFLCLGSTQHLKDKFAEGFTLIVKVKRSRGGVKSNKSSRSSTPEQTISESDVTKIKKYIENNFVGCKLKEEYLGLLTYQIPKGDKPWARIFGLMEKAKVSLNIEDYSLGQSSLEQVFLSFTKYQN